MRDSPQTTGSASPHLVADFDRFSLFTEARERLGHLLARGVGAVLPEVADALEAEADRAPSIVGRRELFAGAATLRIEASSRAQRSLSRLYDLTFKLLEANQSAPEGTVPPLLSLLQDEELELQILADEVARATRERLGPAHETAMRRVDALTRNASDEMRAPLGTAVLAAAAIEAIRPLPGDRGARAAVRATLLERLVPRVADAIVEVDGWLASRGVEPWTPPRTVAAPPPSEPRAPAEAPPVATPVATPEPAGVQSPSAVGTTSSATGSTGAAMPEPVRPAPDAAVPPAPAPDAAPPPPAPAAPTPAAPTPAAPTPAAPAPMASASSPSEPPAPDPDVAMERAAQALVRATEAADVLGLQPLGAPRAEAGHRHAGTLPRPEALQQDAVAFAHVHGVAPYTRAARQRYFEAMRSPMLAAGAPPAQLAALDLVAAMFDYVVDDGRMPDAAQPLLWRLQQPAATLAALDAGFLGDDRRSVRRLVENLAAISVAYADDVVQGSELYRRLETVVRAVEVVSHAFQVRSTVLGGQVKREYERASSGVAQLVARVANERRALEQTPDRRNRRDYSRRPSRDREQAVTQRIETELRERLERVDVPDSVRDFLLGVWLRHLRTAVLRDGDDSPQYKVALQVVDDLLWTLDTSAARQSRRQLANRIPPLIRLITQGVTDIGARPDEFRPFLDELFLIHLRKMQKVPRETVIGPPPAHDESPAGTGSSSTATAGSADAGQGAPPVAPPPTAEPSGSVPGAPVPPMPWNGSAHDVPGAAGGEGPSVAPAPTEPIASTPAAPPYDGGAADPLPTLDEPLAEPTPAERRPLAPSRVDARTPARPEDAGGNASGEQRLLGVLSTLELGDFPADPQRLRLDPDEAMDRLRRGDWLELLARDGTPQEVKVAWINARRTVILLVRRPDRRALSLRASEMRERFAEHRATLIV